MSPGIMSSFVNKKAIITLIGIVSCLICLSHQAPRSGRNKQCGPFQWFDDNVNACGPCKELCDRMTITRTETECTTHCKEYLIERSCTQEQYYDENIGSCGQCSELCGDSDITRTTDECRSKCAAYLEKTKQVFPIGEVDPAPSANKAKASTADHEELSIVSIVVIAVSVFGVCVGIILIAVFLKRRGTCSPSHEYKPASNGNDEVASKPPVQETQQHIWRQASN